MSFPPHYTLSFPKLPLEEIEPVFANSLFWIAGYDIQKHAWVKSKDYNESAYDQNAWSKLVKDQQTKDLIQSTLDAIECSPGSPEVQQGMNILLKGEPGTGKKTVAHAVCNRLKRPMLLIEAHDIPLLADVKPWAAKLASLAIKWNSVLVVDHEYYFGEIQEHLKIMIREFQSHECICLWVSVISSAIRGPFAATIEFPDLDQQARRQRWLLVFGRDDLAETISRGEHPSAGRRDWETEALLRDIATISSAYEFNGVQIENCLASVRTITGRQNITPGEMKIYLRLAVIDILSAQMTW
ncbi:uncharacterized protein F5147DRAFT_693437 [Suillus discolor]|uniref:ATPase AAA-type core domain-containing protein n=1 Tax=Suillus discolor TaxID=1912936 RepID=A0A9P7F8G3_9AGAM|nr:uncharacterized protein F5147DRAFT_693437 [Suillus discolor]KAG2108947.1 hypothetical protein F5147DRAFT_693437 [Suillus discolor]